ncbi:uncharacterized protein LOC131047702 [Cryptomeria japonica]|uniref:uncharacterized protein LOC131047702 n=1 Tax=Cryptomeria japonica TaxID=3369 RepID=UPI0025AB6CF1|nr:uncharacterized protein LOC131047702 [Cryptomeria japonica]
MGSCFSSRVYHSTAKLVLEDGGLEEFVEPVEVSGILRERAGFFVCNSDCMDYNQYLIPLPVDYQLEVNYLYFLLPVEYLKNPLPASEMVSLARRADGALKRSRYKNRGFLKGHKVMPVVDDGIDRRQIGYSLSTDGVKEPEHDLQSGALKSRYSEGFYRSAEKLKRMASRRTRGARNVGKTKLSTIPEGFAY